MSTFLILITFIGTFALADQPSNKLDSASEEALRKTQGMLKDPKQRAEVLANDPKAKDMDAKVNGVAGGSESLKNEIYTLSADIFEQLTKEAGGDPEKMQKLLVEAL